MIGKFKDLLSLSGGEWLLSFTVREDPRKLIDKIKDDVLSIDVKKNSAKRSKSLNDFCWAMCSDIGNALSPPLPKEEVYRRAIRDVGVYEPLPIREDAIDRFSKTWASRGIGWFIEVVDDSKLPGYKKVFAYYGTSTYTTYEMSKVIDYLKQDMENMGLVIPLSKEEERRLMGEWQKAYFKQNDVAISAAG